MLSKSTIIALAAVLMARFAIAPEFLPAPRNAYAEGTLKAG